jgi:ATP-dependent Clp protease ATP-binding subunit ClpA
VIAKDLEGSFRIALVEAQQARHEYFTVEHLLLALLDNPSAAQVLRSCACSIEDLRKSLQAFIADNTPILPPDSDAKTENTLGFQRVIRHAIMRMQPSSGAAKEVTGADMLVAIFGEKDSHAVYYLYQQGVTRLDVVNFISQGISKAPRRNEEATPETAGADVVGPAEGTPAFSKAGDAAITIAEDLKVSLHAVFARARQARHEFLTVEHLLLGLLDNPSAAEVLRSCARNTGELRADLQTFIAENTPILSPDSRSDTMPTLGFQRAIQRAILHVQSTSNGNKLVTGADVLAACFGEKDSHAVYYLQQQGVTRRDLST